MPDLGTSANSCDIGERVDQGAAERYETLKIDYRPRYTPLLRALAAGAETVTEITSNSSLTQGAISQTVSLMLKGGLLARRGLDDGRKTGLRLTKKGVALLTTLEPHRQMTFLAIRCLELESDIRFLRCYRRSGRRWSGKGSRAA